MRLAGCLFPFLLPSSLCSTSSSLSPSPSESPPASPRPSLPDRFENAAQNPKHPEPSVILCCWASWTPTSLPLSLASRGTTLEGVAFRDQWRRFKAQLSSPVKQAHDKAYWIDDGGEGGDTGWHGLQWALSSASHQHCHGHYHHSPVLPYSGINPCAHCGPPCTCPLLHLCLQFSSLLMASPLHADVWRPIYSSRCSQIARHLSQLSQMDLGFPPLTVPPAFPLLRPHVTTGGANKM